MEKSTPSSPNTKSDHRRRDFFESEGRRAPNHEKSSQQANKAPRKEEWLMLDNIFDISFLEKQ
jgi:hypothetical protein